MADHVPGLLAASRSSYGVSNWFQWKNNAETAEDVSDHFNRPCHAEMLYSYPGWTDLITAVDKTDEASLAYQKMLIYGPFKGFSDQITLHQVGKEYFVHCSGLDVWPANVIYNYCIATRVPREHSIYLPHFMKLVEKGYDPTLAFLLSWSTYGKGRSHRTFPSLSHYWHDVTSDWSSIISGTFTKPSVSFFKNPTQCIPSNSIWGIDPGIRRLNGKSDEQIAKMFNMLPVVQAPIEPPKPKIEKLPGAMAFNALLAAHQHQQQLNQIVNGIQPGDLINVAGHPAWQAQVPFDNQQPQPEMNDAPDFEEEDPDFD